MTEDNRKYDPPNGLINTRRGFSLVELLIVIAFLGIVAGIVMPQFEVNVPQQLTSAAQILTADLEYARNLAVSNNSSYRVRFDVTENRYVLQHIGNNPQLNVLPPSPFGNSPGNQSNQQITDLDDFPHVGLKPQLVAIEKISRGQGVLSSAQTVGDLDFGPLGETLKPEEMVIWLAAGQSNARRYLPIRVTPITGLISIGDIDSVAPPPIRSTVEESR